ncbi:MAG TPA: hypothetical protein VNE42_02970 [Acidimicrobiales bacterium]|nr:hypothetical protein [Acidimicrobiales bacterium]
MLKVATAVGVTCVITSTALEKLNQIIDLATQSALLVTYVS